MLAPSGIQARLEVQPSGKVRGVKSTSRAAPPKGQTETRSANNFGPTKVRLCAIHSHLVCALCGGYLVDATTVTECLHSFCRGCILRYLESSRNCPICDVQIYRSKPSHNLRLDRTLQSLVYKMVPGLYEEEMRRRREFFKEHPDSRPRGRSLQTREARGEVCRRKNLHGNEEKISLVLQNCTRLRLGKTSVVSDKKDEKTCDRRYLLCPPELSIRHLKKFIKCKFGLGPEYNMKPLKLRYIVLEESSAPDKDVATTTESRIRDAGATEKVACEADEVTARTSVQRDSCDISTLALLSNDDVQHNERICESKSKDTEKIDDELQKDSVEDTVRTETIQDESSKAVKTPSEEEELPSTEPLANQETFSPPIQETHASVNENNERFQSKNKVDNLHLVEDRNMRKTQDNQLVTTKRGDGDTTTSSGQLGACDTETCDKIVNKTFDDDRSSSLKLDRENNNYRFQTMNKMSTQSKNDTVDSEKERSLTSTTTPALEPTTETNTKSNDLPSSSNTKQEPPTVAIKKPPTKGKRKNSVQSQSSAPPRYTVKVTGPPKVPTNSPIFNLITGTSSPNVMSSATKPPRLTLSNSHVQFTVAAAPGMKLSGSAIQIRHPAKGTLGSTSLGSFVLMPAVSVAGQKQIQVLGSPISAYIPVNSQNPHIVKLATSAITTTKGINITRSSQLSTLPKSTSLSTSNSTPQSAATSTTNSNDKRKHEKSQIVVINKTANNVAKSEDIHILASQLKLPKPRTLTNTPRTPVVQTSICGPASPTVNQVPTSGPMPATQSVTSLAQSLHKQFGDRGIKRPVTSNPILVTLANSASVAASNPVKPVASSATSVVEAVTSQLIGIATRPLQSQTTLSHVKSDMSIQKPLAKTTHCRVPSSTSTTTSTYSGISAETHSTLSIPTVTTTPVMNPNAVEAPSVRIKAPAVSSVAPNPRLSSPKETTSNCTRPPQNTTCTLSGPSSSTPNPIGSKTSTTEAPSSRGDCSVSTSLPSSASSFPAKVSTIPSSRICDPLPQKSMSSKPVDSQKALPITPRNTLENQNAATFPKPCSVTKDVAKNSTTTSCTTTVSPTRTESKSTKWTVPVCVTNGQIAAALKSTKPVVLPKPSMTLKTNRQANSFLKSQLPLPGHCEASVAEMSPSMYEVAACDVNASEVNHTTPKTTNDMKDRMLNSPASVFPASPRKQSTPVKLSSNGPIRPKSPIASNGNLQRLVDKIVENSIKGTSQSDEELDLHFPNISLKSREVPREKNVFKGLEVTSKRTDAKPPSNGTPEADLKLVPCGQQNTLYQPLPFDAGLGSQSPTKKLPDYTRYRHDVTTNRRTANRASHKTDSLKDVYSFEDTSIPSVPVSRNGKETTRPAKGKASSKGDQKTSNHEQKSLEQTERIPSIVTDRGSSRSDNTSSSENPQTTETVSIKKVSSPRKLTLTFQIERSDPSKSRIISGNEREDKKHDLPKEKPVAKIPKKRPRDRPDNGSGRAETNDPMKTSEDRQCPPKKNPKIKKGSKQQGASKKHKTSKVRCLVNGGDPATPNGLIPLDPMTPKEAATALEIPSTMRALKQSPGKERSTGDPLFLERSNGACTTDEDRSQFPGRHDVPCVSTTFPRHKHQKVYSHMVNNSAPVPQTQTTTGINLAGSLSSNPTRTSEQLQKHPSVVCDIPFNAERIPPPMEESTVTEARDEQAIHMVDGAAKRHLDVSTQPPALVCPTTSAPSNMPTRVHPKPLPRPTSAPPLQKSAPIHRLSYPCPEPLPKPGLDPNTTTAFSFTVSSPNETPSCEIPKQYGNGKTPEAVEYRNSSMISVKANQRRISHTQALQTAPIGTAIPNVVGHPNPPTNNATVSPPDSIPSLQSPLPGYTNHPYLCMSSAALSSAAADAAVSLVSMGLGFGLKRPTANLNSMQQSNNVDNPSGQSLENKFNGIHGMSQGKAVSALSPTSQRSSGSTAKRPAPVRQNASHDKPNNGIETPPIKKLRLMCNDISFVNTVETNGNAYQTPINTSKHRRTKDQAQAQRGLPQSYLQPSSRVEVREAATIGRALVPNGEVASYPGASPHRPPSPQLVQLPMPSYTTNNNNGPVMLRYPQHACLPQQFYLSQADALPPPNFGNGYDAPLELTTKKARDRHQERERERGGSSGDIIQSPV